MRTAVLTLALLTTMPAADLDHRLSQWLPVKMPFEASRFTARERRMIEHLVEASRQTGNIYWRQNDPEGLRLYQSLQPGPLRRLLAIHGGRFDLLDHHKNFASTEPMPPGRALYPPDITRREIERYVQAHPEKREAIYSPYTVVRRQGGELTATPYRVEYRPFLERAAAELRKAAELSADAAFAHYLRLRAGALLSDDYYSSDLAWVDLKDPRFDLILAPYETYIDDVLGVKTSYEGAVLIRNEAESARLALFQKYLPEIQEALPLPPEDRPSKHGQLSPMQVMDAPFRSGDLRHGYQAVANNLPNDPRIHQRKGSKKTFFKNFMDARVNHVILPLARRLMGPEQAARATSEGYFTVVLMHEIAHGLGPAFARVGGRQVDIREAAGPVYSALEEAKADAAGLFGLHWLVERGVLPRDRLPEYYASFVAGIFRTVRFGTAEAHGRAEMMEFNFLREQKAITGYQVHYDRMPAAVARLTRELLAIEAAGDRARAEAWFRRYDAMPADLQAALAKTGDVPVDIDPVFDFPERFE